MCLAIPGQIVEFCDPERFFAHVDVSGVHRTVNVALLSAGPHGVQVGDWVLVHVSSAIAAIDEQEALATRALFVQLGSAYEQELEQQQTSAAQ
jgi:hydrogenase expression/formation protein HypC